MNIKPDSQRALQSAKQIAGGATALGEKLGVSKQAVSAWDRVPGKHVIAVEKLTGIAREQLRPDLYPPRKPTI